MSILKMKFISIVGLREYFEQFAFNYVIDSSIQLENSLNFLENVKGLSPYNNDNPYYDLISRSTALINSMGLSRAIEERAGQDTTEKLPYASDEIRSRLTRLEKEMGNIASAIEDSKEQLDKYQHMQKQLELLENLDVDIERFFNFEFIKFRFGKMPKKTYKQLLMYLDDLEAIVNVVSSDQDYVWLIYFTPRKYGDKVDGIFSSLYFERIRISAEVKGTPSEALAQVKKKITKLEEEIKKSEAALKSLVNTHREEAENLYLSSVRLNRITEIRKYAAHTAESFYIIGWMPEEDLNLLLPILDKDEKILYIQEDPSLLKTMNPPTELRNSKVFKPFETLVRMYGLPSYNEIDPTTFVGITYFIMFGLMFGDVGQGLILFLGGLLLLRLKVALGGVILGAGFSSFLFGFLYGSIFGFEEWIRPLWLKPMDNINTMLVFGISTGVTFITIAMILNITNGIKNRDFARIFLDRNGVAGFVFYWGAIISALFAFLYGKALLPTGIIVIILMLPLVAMFLKEPVENLVHRKRALPHNKGVFFIQTFFEMFDTLLSFISNTISFIRLSAFSLNHAGLFMAVMILAEMASGFTGVVEIIIGNILIIALEGLIVGIQALRLEYYELFSRFFTGDGRPYKPLKNQYYS